MKKTLLSLLISLILCIISCENTESKPTPVSFNCEVSTDVWIENSATINITISTNTTCRVRVEWGDNSVDDWGNPYQASHTYQSVGTYTAKVIVTPDDQKKYETAEQSYTIKVFRITGYDIKLSWGPYPEDDQNAYALLYPERDQDLTNTYLFMGYVVLCNFDKQPVKTLINTIDFPEDHVLFVDFKIYTPHVGDEARASLVADLIAQKYTITGVSKTKWLMNWKGIHIYWFAVLLNGDIITKITNSEVLHSAVGMNGGVEYEVTALGMKISLTPCKNYTDNALQRELSKPEKELIGKAVQRLSEYFGNALAQIQFPIIKMLDCYESIEDEYNNQ